MSLTPKESQRCKAMNMFFLTPASDQCTFIKQVIKYKGTKNQGFWKVNKVAVNFITELWLNHKYKPLLHHRIDSFQNNTSANTKLQQIESPVCETAELRRYKWLRGLWCVQHGLQ